MRERGEMKESSSAPLVRRVTARAGGGEVRREGEIGQRRPRRKGRGVIEAITRERVEMKGEGMRLDKGAPGGAGFEAGADRGGEERGERVSGREARAALREGERFEREERTERRKPSLEIEEVERGGAHAARDEAAG